MPKLIVASNSPRRHQLIKEVGFQFEVKVMDVDESLPKHISAEDAAAYLAEKKNKAYRGLCEGEVILTADTIVVANHEILGKPKSEAEAFEMIRSLTSAPHEVITGVCISSEQKSVCFSDTTSVEFEELTNDEIRHYIINYQPFDKAGSYGIQEWIGMIGVKSIHGSFYNVMGLPINKVYKILKSEFGILPK